MAARLVQLAGTRAGGFVLTRQEPPGHRAWTQPDRRSLFSPYPRMALVQEVVQRWGAAAVRIEVAAYFNGTIAVTSISIIMPGQASWLMVRSVWQGISFRTFPGGTCQSPADISRQLSK
jgi:hypothetical protein